MKVMGTVSKVFVHAAIIVYGVGSDGAGIAPNNQIGVSCDDARELQSSEKQQRNDNQAKMLVNSNFPEVTKIKFDFIAMEIANSYPPSGNAKTK